MSESRTLAYQRIGIAAGIAASVVWLICILAAIASYPAFNWTNNALSDLGVVSGITGSIFNFGLFASGLLGFGFAIFGLLSYFRKSWVGRIGSAVFASATLALLAIGIFNESFSPTHYLVSVAFFVLAPISLFFLTIAFWLAHQRRIAGFTVMVAFAAAFSWLLTFTFSYVPNVAIPEFLSGLAVSAWVIVASAKMLKPKLFLD